MRFIAMQAFLEGGFGDMYLPSCFLPSGTGDGIGLDRSGLVMGMGMDMDMVMVMV